MTPQRQGCEQPRATNYNSRSDNEFRKARQPFELEIEEIAKRKNQRGKRQREEDLAAE
jgi:hypothetical protein